jgi:glutamate transport system permease protein
VSSDRVLFDAPGPVGRRRIRIATVATVLVIAAVIALAVKQFGDNGQLAAERWTPFGQLSYLRFLWDGLKGTLLAAGAAALISFPAGAVFGLMRISVRRPVRWVAGVYVELFRAVPLLLLIYAFLLGLPRLGVNLPIFWKLVVPIVLVNTAVLAELVRAGIGAVDRGQFEAGEAVGLRRGQVLRLVVLPQALRLIVPTLVTQLTTLLKDTTLGYVVSYPELMKQGNNLTVYTHLLIQTYLIVAVVYVVINLLLSQLAHALDRRLGRRRVVDAGRAAGGGGGTHVAHETELAGDRIAPMGQLF